MRHYIYCLLIVCYFILLSVTVAGQSGSNCRHYQNTQGLSYNTVMCLYQDCQGFIWIGTKNGLNRFDGCDFRVYRRGNYNNCLPNSIINSITETHDGKLWVATDNGVAIYDQNKDKFYHFNMSTSNGEIITGYIHSVNVDGVGNVWIVAAMGTYVYNKRQGLQNIRDRIKAYKGANPSLVFIGQSDIVYIYYKNGGIIQYDIGHRHYREIAKLNFPVTVIKEYDDNSLLIGSSKGLYKLSLLNKVLTKISLGKFVDNNIYVRAITQVDTGMFWIGTESGIYIYTNRVENHLTHSIYSKSFLSDNAVYAILKDKDGGLWIGTYFGGVDYIPQKDPSLLSFIPELNCNSVCGSRIRAFAYDTDNNLWIGTEDKGLNMRSASSGNFIYKNTLGNVDITGINIQCIKLIKNKLWIGTFNKGIYVYDMIQNKTKHYLAGTKEGALPSNDIFSIFEDSRGNIWIGSSSGLYRYDLNTRKFIALAKFNNLFVSDIKEDTFGNLWIATYNKGAVRYNYKRDDFRIYRYSRLNTTTICYDRITYIFKDNRGQLWFASEDGGMCLYNPKADTFERFDTSNGLPSNSIYCIQQDNNNMIWLSTSNGIATFNPNTKKIIALYGVSNDLPTKQFNYAAGIKNSEGHILFGSIMGYVELVPERLKTHTGNKPVILTGFSVYESGEILSNDEILTGNIDRLRKIILNYKQNTFTINFSTLDFANEGKGFYKYMLDGYDKVWNYISNDNKVIYRNVQPGKYTFRILHLNSWSDKKGEETKIQIIIHPPFWSSWWAYCIYVIIIAIILWLILKKIQNYRKVQRQQRIRQQEIEQEERLYQEKINFFISIAHEIRTPVTLIKAPLEQLLNTTPSKKDLDKNLYTIRRNTERLQNLINQLLDFKKVEAESFRLQMKVVNMKKLLQSMITRFNPTTVSLSKKIDFECDEETVLAQVDEEAITKIISNLLTNAIKYGEKYIKVSLVSNISTNNMCISVRNDGEIIPEEMRDKIFEAFVQIKDKSHIAQGTGLGLALTKSLVNLHSGTIRIDDKADDNCFIVEIPLNIDSSIYCKDGVLEEEKLNKRSLQPETVRKNTLLIVEDDLEMRTFLSDQLSMKYNIIEAENGKVALEMVKKIKINIILSDIVMPEMTGLELCSEIKSNISTCNIPIILLTAKATFIDKIEGLEKGADSYIEKPFSMKHLIVQIDTLIANQKKIRQNFADAPLHVFNDISTNDKDKEFIDSITNIIVNFMHEEDFSVDSLADHLNMSRSKLHRKIKIITGQTPNELIRIVRMNKAAEFLASGNYRISEVCTKIGVQSLSHFTKSFVKQFGILPKDFVKEV